MDITLPPGILSVAFSVTRLERCSKKKFCEWSEDQHVDVIVKLSCYVTSQLRRISLAAL